MSFANSSADNFCKIFDCLLICLGTAKSEYQIWFYFIKTESAIILTLKIDKIFFDVFHTEFLI